MSRTENEHRNSIGLYKPHKGKNGIVGKKWNRTPRKMKPLLGDDRRNYGKYTFADGDDVYHSFKTKSLKLEVKNANRSVKKRERQMVKQEIKTYLEGNDESYLEGNVEFIKFLENIKKELKKN